MTQIALSLLHASGNSLEDHSTMLQRSLWLASSIGELPLLGLQQFVTSVLGMVIFLSSELLSVGLILVEFSHGIIKLLSLEQ